jgi:hypothetical protein
VASAFTPGANAYTVTGSTVDFNGAGAQTIPAFGYNNLTSSNAGARTLASSGTVGVAGTFTPGANAYTITGSTVDYNGTGAQSLPSGFTSYNNLTVSGARGGASVTLPAVSVGVGGTFTPSATSVSYGKTGNTLDFNGAGAQMIPAFAYNNLTSSNAGARTLASSGTVGVAGTFTPGANSYTVTGSTVDYNGSGAQSLPSGFTSYNNLTVSGARGGASVTLPAVSVGVAGAFTPSATAVSYVKTGNTLDFNGAGAQTVPAFAYNNLTSSNAGARTLASSGTVGVAGTFTPGANSYTVTGSTVDFNGAGAQTVPAFAYNNLTSSNAGARTLASSGTVGVAGTFTPGANAYTVTGSTVDVNGAGAQTVSAFAYNNLTSSNAGARTLASSGTVGVAGTFTPGANSYTVTGSTVAFNGAGAQTIPAFGYNNLTSSNAGGRTLASSGTVGVAGTFTPGANSYTVTGSTVEYNGSSAQILPAAFTTYDNLTINNPAGATGFAGLTVQGTLYVKLGTFTSASTYKDVVIDNGGTLAAAPASTITGNGNWTDNHNAGSGFTPGTGTVVFGKNGTATLSLPNQAAGVETFCNLTVNASTILATGADFATLAGGAGCGTLTNSGQVQHVETATIGAGGGTFNDGYQHAALVLSNIATGLGSTTATVAAGGTYPAAYEDCGFPLPLSRVNRFWSVTPTTADSATVRFWFRDAGERNGQTLANLKLWRCASTGGSWTQVGSNYQTSSAPDPGGYDYFQADAVPIGSAFLLAEFAPTAVTVTSFRALSARPSAVKLGWRTGNELALVGFNLWRKSSSAKTWTKLNPKLIAAKRHGAGGSSYTYVDRKALAGRAYTYRLQAVLRGGDKTLFGAVAVKVRAGK